MHRSAEGAQGRALVWSGTHVVRCREPMLDERHQACMREIVISGIGLIKHRIARILRTGARGCVLLFVWLWRDFHLWACAPVAWGTSGHPPPVPRHCEMAQNAVANGGAQIDFKALATNVQGFDHALDYVTVNKTASIVRSTPYAEWRAVPAAGGLAFSVCVCAFNNP